MAGTIFSVEFAAARPRTGGSGRRPGIEYTYIILTALHQEYLLFRGPERAHSRPGTLRRYELSHSRAYSDRIALILSTVKVLGAYRD